MAEYRPCIGTADAGNHYSWLGTVQFVFGDEQYFNNNLYTIQTWAVVFGIN